MSSTHKKTYKFLSALLFILSIFPLNSCNKQDVPKDVSHCIRKKINQYDRKAACFEANVKEYFFQGFMVYVFDPGACMEGLTTEVYSEDCTFLGIIDEDAGNTEISGKDFSSAVYQRTIWEN